MLDDLQLDWWQIKDLALPQGDDATLRERLATPPTLHRMMDKNLIRLCHRF